MRLLHQIPSELKSSRRLLQRLFAVYLFFLLLFGLIGYVWILRPFLHLESEELKRVKQSVEVALEREILYIDSIVKDVAFWDDTWNYLREPENNKDYVITNLEIETPINLSLEYMAIINRDRTILYQIIVDTEEEEITSWPSFPSDRLNENILLPKDREVYRGIFKNGTDLIILSIRNVYKGDGKGPSAGYYMVGKKVDENLMEQMRGMSYPYLDITPLDPQEIDSIQTKRYRGDSLILQELLPDIYGTPAALLTVNYKRTILNAGKNSLVFYIISVIVNMIAIGLITMHFIENHMIFPLKLLLEHMNRINDKDDFSLRLEMERQDEFGILSADYNRLLDLIEENNSRLIEMANRDELTGLHNRRFINEYIESISTGEQETGSALMIDIDYFKKYNDRYGHIAGDHCIRQVAEVIKDTATRPADISSRYGGEEFIILLFDTSREGALTVAEKIQATLRKMKIPHENSPVQPYVTVSGGLSFRKSLKSKEDILEMINEADKALYQSKEEGRDRITFFKETFG
ncbi:MAG: diguanylate cyclase [Spirochaetales bacterium]|nr:diguanylate cyclase [Spirochaetales bacterium]